VLTGHSNVDYDMVRDHAQLIFDTRNVYKGQGSDSLIIM